MKRTKVFFDGGSRPDPIGMETAVVFRGRSYIQRGLGSGGSMEAEWLALIDAMRRAVAADLSDVLLLGDAAAVIAQANGVARCPRAHRAQLALFRALPRPAGTTTIRYLRRHQNLAGIALEKLR